MSIINKAFEGAKLQINLSSLVVAAIKHLYPSQDLDTLDVGKTDMIVTEAVESILKEIQEKNLTVLYQTPEKYEVVEKVWEEVFSIVEDPETKRRNTYLGSFLVEELSVELPIAPYTVEYIEQLEDQSDVALGHASNVTVVDTGLLQQQVQVQTEVSGAVKEKVNDNFNELEQRLWGTQKENNKEPDLPGLNSPQKERDAYLCTGKNGLRLMEEIFNEELLKPNQSSQKEPDVFPYIGAGDLMKQMFNEELLKQTFSYLKEEDRMHLGTAEPNAESGKPTDYPTNDLPDQEHPGNSNTEITLTDAMLKYYLRGMHKETDND